MNKFIDTFRLLEQANLMKPIKSNDEGFDDYEEKKHLSLKYDVFNVDLFKVIDRSKHSKRINILFKDDVGEEVATISISYSKSYRSYHMVDEIGSQTPYTRVLINNKLIGDEDADKIISLLPIDNLLEDLNLKAKNIMEENSKTKEINKVLEIKEKESLVESAIDKINKMRSNSQESTKTKKLTIND